jgi:hypothetical protein
MFAGYHSYTEDTLGMMNPAMAGSKSLLRNLVETRDSGNFDRIPKLHMMRHYTKGMCDFRSCDKCVTEQSEAAHSWMINLIDSYRSMNKVKHILHMLRRDDRLFKLKGHTTLLQYLIKTSS